MMKVGHECQVCEATSQLAQHIVNESTKMLQEALADMMKARAERDAAVDRADKMHLLGLKLGRELADIERENASLRRRLREGGR